MLFQHELDAAQKVWAQRIDATDRAKKAESLARRDVERMVRRCVRAVQESIRKPIPKRNRE